MDKVLVNVYVPILNASYDMFLPLTLQMHEALELIKKAVSEMSDGRFVSNSNNILSYRSNGKIVNINLSVYELGIRNGSMLMLI